MQDLRVTFESASDKSYQARLTDAGGTALGVEVPITPFLSEKDYDDLRWYLEEYMDLPDGGAVVRAGQVEANLGRWGRALHHALFGPEENRTLLRTLLDGPEPRELTIATAESALLRLP